jgi:thiamine biosynthesis lipoprotein
MPHAERLPLDAFGPLRPQPVAGIAPPLRARRELLTAACLAEARPEAERRLATDYWIRVRRRAMACDFEVTLASEDAAGVPAARAALDDVDRVEEELTVFRDTSAVCDVNRRAAHEAVPVGEHLFALLQLSRDLQQATGGAFDITSTPLSRCWGFLRRDGRLPSPDEISAARALSGFDRVHLDPHARSVRFDRDGVELNLGAIGKGYALDRIACGLREAGVSHALLSAGRSSVLAVGGRASGWHVELVSPRVNQPLAQVWLRDAALGTSGAGEQFIDCNGTRYGHVIDPRTGWPAQGTLSVTVIASSAAAADALSTAFLVGGADLAEQYCSAHRDVMAIVTKEPDVRTVGRSDARFSELPNVRTPERPMVFGSHPGAVVQR